MNFPRLNEALEDMGGQLSAIDLIVCAAGVFVLALWLLRTSLGTKSLVDSHPRRNNMPVLYAFIPLFVWFGTASVLFFIKEKALADLPDWQDALADNLISCISVAPTVAAGLVIAGTYFARRLRGFGLDPRTTARDLGAAFLNLLAIMPAVLAMIILTTLIGKIIAGPGFEMPRHDELKQIIAYSQWQVRAVIIVTAVVIVPFTEELIFRGMLQTLLRRFSVRPWPAIILASLVFIVFHANPQHWPALFMLSLCLGYAYEKSGSLLRSIFIHSLFNALSVFATLGQ
jgi:membrane protease YdiL (CAAX protease family)